MDKLTGHAPYTPITVGAKTTPTDVRAMYCEEGQCEFNGLMEALKAKEAENARLRAALAPFSRQVEMWEASGSKPPEARFLAYTSEGGATVMGFVSVGDVLKAHNAYQQRMSKEG